MKIKWHASRIGYDAGCTGYISGNECFQFEAIQNRFAKTVILTVWDARSDSKLFESSFKNMESVENYINENYLKNR